ncbi:hypothetical protein [Acanthamoeba castellanii mimivirus]|uniref:Uncharacterized protein R889 n=5 Tax=Mimivirus TaxID=315393 RepID=YR889_MIMIV|nr:hypothetical protein MIMI_gp0954 [Acanthamoeba polyphaga mimivirus]Q5UQY1.1 RecName: Full=Uncharacterized protein R889 [Acanthamoeba polyphaga mimivirus]AEQ61109.1 hypothetical protein [Acanthamoeba castellanii mamavirus]AHA44932.1 hypothetical protein HIRU_S26 [Hirudovirus strain Sangsue]ALR84526.1 hypothetical protein [Niemeyer virus]AMK62095.1 hypothetical protein [Samba virus]AMZ03326.1 hypothetical protein [Mimivirus Bombay]EJN40505.1 hypothetical protein lvs_R780 [Acanthamoeba polyp
MTKSHCRNKLIQLFLDYGCEFRSYLKKFDVSHIKIIRIIDCYRNYFKTINNELRDVQTEIIYKPDSLRSNIFKIQWEIHNGLSYDVIKKHNQKLFDYFGIQDEEKLIRIIGLVE